MFRFLQSPQGRRFHALVAALFVYEFVFQLGASALILYGPPVFADGGLAMILAGGFGAALMYLMLRPWLFASGENYAGMRIPLFIAFFVLMSGMQLLSYWLTLPAETLLRALGFTLESAQQSAHGVEASFWITFYTVIAAPFIEEIVYRGMILDTLKPCGRVFSILISGLLFALMHTNVLQFMPTFLLGMLFAWIAQRYGLRWTLALHILNNLSVQLNGFLGGTFQVLLLLSAALMLLGLIGGTAALIVNSRNIRAAVTAENTLPAALRRFFTTPTVVLFIAFLVLLAASNLN